MKCIELCPRIETDCTWNLHDRWKAVDDGNTVEVQTLRHFDRDEDITNGNLDKIDNSDKVIKNDHISDMTKKNLVTIYLRTNFWDSLGSTLQERKDNFLQALSQGPGESKEFLAEGSDITHSFPKTKDPEFTGLILSVSDAWMESARERVITALARIHQVWFTRI